MYLKAAVFLVLSSCCTFTLAQNCGVTGEESTITTDAVLETSEEGFVLWEGLTYNVASAAAVAHPHTKYIDGFRYATRYEYRTSAEFQAFVQTERSLEVERPVIFTCTDTGTVPYTFHIPVLDENTEAPSFEHPTYNATIRLSEISTDPIDIGIFVRDADVDPKNANLFIRSSNPYVLLFISPLWTDGEIPSPHYEYKVNFMPQSLGVGKYNIILTADDTAHSTYAIFELNVLQ